MHTAESDESYSVGEDDDDEEEITVSTYYKQESDTFEPMGDIGLGNDPVHLETFPPEDQSEL